MAGRISKNYEKSTVILTPYKNTVTVGLKDFPKKKLRQFNALNLLVTTQKQVQDYEEYNLNSVESIPWGADDDYYHRENVPVQQVLNMAKDWGIDETYHPIVHHVSKADPQTYKVFLETLAKVEEKNIVGVIIVPADIHETLAPVIKESLKAYQFSPVQPMVVAATHSERAFFSLAFGMVVGLSSGGMADTLILEAALMRVPRVVLGQGGMDEFVEDGKTGFVAQTLADLPKKIDQLSSLDESAYLEMVKQAREDVLSHWQREKQIKEQLIYYGRRQTEENRAGK